MTRAAPPGFTVKRLQWADEELGTIALPAKPLTIRTGFGSGLTVRPGDPPHILWSVCDRGPNIKSKTAVKEFGLERLEGLKDEEGAKIMPRLDLGPAIAELRIREDRVELVRSFRIQDAKGLPVSGLPVPEGGHAQCEPAFDLDGKRLAPDPSGMDTEGIAAASDGGFWVGDEFGPSLVRTDGEGRVLKRLMPRNCPLGEAAYPVETTLPEIAARRQLNRGFEALTYSADGAALFLAFQSPLAHPDEDAHKKGRHVRLWRLDPESGEVTAQYLYPLDPPQSFRRDSAEKKIEWDDLKVSEITHVGEDSLLVLERASKTTKIYRVTPAAEAALPPEHLDIATRPTVEELSASDRFELPVLEKRLVVSSDDAPEVAADLEGMAMLSPTELLLVNDNDFGVEGAKTSFWKIVFDEPVLC